MDLPKFNEREKALENDYIRRREAEKFKSAVPKPAAASGQGSQQQQQQSGNAGQQK